MIQGRDNTGDDLYATHFGFHTPPFSVAASPQFFYEGPLYREAALSLFFSIRQLRRLIVLTGPSGTGKTTLLYRIVSQLTSCYQTFYIPHCPRTLEDFLVTTGRYRDGQNTAPWSPLTLGEVLKLSHRIQKRAVVVLDDAHNLSDEALTALNLLLNLETLSTPLLTLVLAGDSSLEARLHQPALGDLQKRIDLHLRLHNLRFEEIDPYIAYRVRTAGSNAQDLFSPEAVERITQYSQGVPRLINLFCDNALQEAYFAGMRAVSVGLVDKVARELFFVEEAAPHNRPQHIPVVVLPDRRSTPQPKTYPVVLKPRARQLAWLTLAILLSWFSLFQLTPPLQLTHNELRQRNARPTAPSAVSPTQPLQLEDDPSILASASQVGQRQEPMPVNTARTSIPTSESLATRIVQASDAATIKEPSTPAPTFRPTSQPQSSVSAPRRNKQQPLLAHSSPTTGRTSPREAAQAQLARLGIAATHPALLASVKRGDMRATHLLLTAGVSPNAQDDQGWTPLMFAARDDRQDLAHLLIAHGTNVNAKTKTGGTALILAAMNNHVAMTQTLINKGAHVNAKNSQGWTALTYAAWKGHEQVVTTLLTKGAKTQVQDSLGWTPLQYATWRQDRRAQQEHLQEEIAEALGVNLKAEPLTVTSHRDYGAISHLLSPSRQTH